MPCIAVLITMRTIRATVIWLTAVAALVALASCDPMSSVDYKVHNLTEDTITVAMYKEILTSDYQGYTIVEKDSVISRYGVDDTVSVAVLGPHQALWVHNDWNGLYREEQIVPLWKYIKSIRVGDTERAATTWDSEKPWHLKTEGGTRFKGESRYYDLYIRSF